MAFAGPDHSRLTPEPLPANVRSVQPGGGVCYQMELFWGRWRRWYLKRFRPGYVRRMAELCQGDPAGAPHEILDPRDLKYCRNQCTCDWRAEDDPFRWRETLPFARWGLAELQILGWPLAALTAILLVWPWHDAGWLRLLALVPGLPLALVVWFFRDPLRAVPAGEGVIVSPADGTVAEVTRLEHEPFVDGPAVRIGIFLSIFNVHLNRSPSRCRVIALRYCPGEFLNALRPESALHNENMWVGLEEEAPPHRRLIVRQIAGAIARRIVCAARPGEVLDRGQRFGMIKLGSRTELILPDRDGLRIDVQVGQRVKAGSSVVGKYEA